MRTTKLFAGLAFAGLFTLVGSARADGIGVQARYLKQSDRAALKAEITKARAKHPAVFKTVAQAPDIAREVDENKRGRAASITLPLKALGPDALYPMLEMLAIDGPPRGKLSDSAWTTLRVGLLEAVGMIGDAKAKPVLTAVLDRESQFEIVRAATEALGRLGDDASAKKLAKLATKPGSRQAGVLAGIGECRRVVCAQALASFAGAQDASAALVIIKSLQDVGNAYAWKTPSVAKSGEGDQVRALAADALVKLFVANPGYPRQKAITALQIVAAPSTPKLIQAAKQGADPELAAALDELAYAFANNPAK